ncbi:MAG TPA: hypothetical protein DCP37_05035 [Dehalococcoidia bacterium]|nr:hypothetical protein [Dehalococcoidia bacterium]
MKMKTLILGAGIAALFVFGVACDGSDVDDQTPAVVESAPQSAPAQTSVQPRPSTAQVAPAPAAAPAPSGVAPPSAAVQTSPPVSITAPSSGSMIPRAANIEQLVTSAQLIVVGTINSVLDEKQIGGYGVGGQLMPAEDGGNPVTDFDVRVESVLKSDGTVAEGEGFVLRMHGHTSSDPAVVASVLFELPKAGDRLLFALGRNPDGTFGSGPEGLLDVGDAIVTYADGEPFAAQMSPDQLVEDIRDLSAAESTPVQQVAVSHSPADSDGGMTEDEFVTLLTAEDIMTILSAKISLTTQTVDMREMAEGVDASQVETIESWYWLALGEAGIDRGLSFSVMDFDSEDAALAHYGEVTSDDSGMFQMTLSIGYASAHVDVNAGGIGGMVVFVSGDKLVTLHTAQDDSLLPLVSISAIETLAKVVAARL